MNLNNQELRSEAEIRGEPYQAALNEHFSKDGLERMEVPPLLGPAKLCECLQCKQTWMNDFLRPYEQVGQEGVHQQENLPRGQQGSFLAAAVGSWEMTDMIQELTETETSKKTTLDPKRKLIKTPGKEHSSQLPRGTSHFTKQIISI